ncbi:hypothetical protein AURDEDRAFT_128742 [Auricularia subglabra TFB-10046 SS5]|nr:hypothetical protein AURDEDRAFT_128742 [Auricularia subglabra TFB-10046 SS5]
MSSLLEGIVSTWNRNPALPLAGVDVQLEFQEVQLDIRFHPWSKYPTLALPRYPQEPDVTLKGHYRDYVQATYQAKHQSDNLDGSALPDVSLVGNETGKWSAKQAVAAAKLLRELPQNDFYRMPDRKDWRKTHATNPDLSFGALSGLMSPCYDSRANAYTNPARPTLNDALEAARSRPETADPEKPGAFWDSADVTTCAPSRAHTPAYSEHDKSSNLFHRSPLPSERGSQVARSSRHSTPAPPAPHRDPDLLDDDGDDEGRRGNRRFGGRGGGNGGGGGGDNPYRGAAYDNDGRGQGLSIDTRIQLDALPMWNGEDRTALAYFNTLNEWARAGRNGSLIHQLPDCAPLRWTGEVLMWWSNLSNDLCSALQSSFLAFLAGIRRHYLSTKWAKDRAVEFAAMQFRQPGFKNETPFDCWRTSAVLAAVCAAGFLADDKSALQLEAEISLAPLVSQVISRFLATGEWTSGESCSVSPS